MSDPSSPPAGEFSASDSSLTDVQEARRPMPDPGLMPLPDAAADLDWSNLVDAAKAYEGESTGERGPAPALAGHAGVNALVSLCPRGCPGHREAHHVAGTLPSTRQGSLHASSHPIRGAWCFLCVGIHNTNLGRAGGGGQPSRD